MRRRCARLAAEACGLIWLWAAAVCGYGGGQTDASSLAAGASHSAGERDGAWSPLTKVAQVRRLTAAQAAGSVPVHLIGTVSGLSGYKNSLFFQDDTAGIDVEQARVPVQVGDMVELTGVTGPGSFAPIIVASGVKILGRAPPLRPRRVTFADMLGGAQDSQWIEVEGTVQSAHRLSVYHRDILILSLDLGGGRMRVLLQDVRSGDEARLVDATVRLRGVCISDFNEKRQFVGLGLIVASQQDLDILQAAPPDPFALPTTPIRNALLFGRTRHRMKVAGVVTYQLPGHYLYLQEGSDGIRVQTASTQTAGLGSVVEAVGFPVSGEYAPVLSDGSFRVIGQAAPVKAFPIEAAKVIDRPGEFTHVNYVDQLVQIKGEVVESRVQGDQQIWILRQAGSVFEAYLPVSASDRKTAGLGSGSVLLLTGICTVHADFDRNPLSFGILLRTPRDIVVLRGTPWWNPKHLLALLAALGAVVLAGTLWVALLRIRVTQLTRSVVENEQRFRYLATHDGLTQLPNRNSILEMLDESLKAAKDSGTGVSVAVLDLDHFKRINDTYGHPAGDEVLRETSKRLASAVRDTDAVGRYGGEEFLIVFRKVEQAIGIHRCEAIRRALCDKPVVFNGKELFISCSIGISNSREGCMEADSLIAEADSALYQAKERGRNRVECFREETAGAPFESGSTVGAER